MDVFAVLVLFGLGIYGLLMIGDRFVDLAREVRAVVAVGIGVGLGWLADLNMWQLWEFLVRDGWIGVTLTGVALAGIAQFWHYLLGYFAGLGPEVQRRGPRPSRETQGLRRVA